MDLRIDLSGNSAGDSLHDARVAGSAQLHDVREAHDTTHDEIGDLRDRARTRETHAFGANGDDRNVVAWAIDLLRLAAVLAVAVQVLETVHEFVSTPEMAHRLIFWHVLTGGLEALVIALTFVPSMRRHWRAAAFAVATIMLVGTAILSSFDDRTERLIVYAFLVVLSAGAMVPWEPRWQAALSITAFLTLAVQICVSPYTDHDFFYHSIAAVAATILAYSGSRLGRFYRTSIADHITALRTSQFRLQDAVRDRDQVIAERDRTEAGLRSSRSSLRKILDAMLDIVVVTRTSDGAFVDFNQEFFRAGFTREDLLQPASNGGSGVWASAAQRQEVHRRVEAEGTVRNMEVDFRRNGGTVVQCLLSAVKVELDGEPCVVSIAQDISTLTEATRKLRDSESTLRTIFDACPDSISIARVSDGQYIDANPTVVDSSGLRRDALMGLSADDLNAWHDPDERAEFLRRLTAVGAVQNMEVGLNGRTGSVTPTLMSAKVVQLRGELCVVAFARDITRLKQTERDLIAAREELSRQLIALGQSEQTFRKLFSANLDALTISDANTGVNIDANDEFVRWTGFSRDEIIGHDFRSINDWVSADEGALYVEQIQRRGEVRNMEMTIRLKNGDQVPALVSAVRLDLEGRSCWLTNMRSIADLKNTQHELVAAREAALSASRAKSEFLSSMSHEIRTPMNTILGMADLLAEGDLSDEQRRYLNLLISNGNLLLRLINSILDLAKIESGRMTLESIPFDPRQVIEEVLDTLAIRAHEKGLELIVRLDDATPARVVGDPLRLGQVLINLVGNAIKFTAHGHVTVAVHPDASDTDLLKFVVTDSGIGIPDDKLALLFDAFTQADSSTSRKFGGSGLGLAIVKRLVGLMNGTVGVESEEGKGSVFWFTAKFKAVPMAKATDATPTPPGREPHLAAAATAPPPASNLVVDRPLGILLVDDSRDNRVLIQAYLKKTPYRVEEAADGQEAVDRFIAGHFDVVLMDIQMPILDGYEAARKIRDWERKHGKRRTPVLALTASALDDAVILAKEAGCDAHVSKPVKKSTLLAAIKDAVEAGANASHDTAAAELAPRQPTASSNDGGTMQDREQHSEQPSETVEIDADLGDLVPGFLQRKRVEAANILQAVAVKDYELIKAVAHRIKGEGGSYGFEAITEMGRAFERALTTRNDAEITAIANRLTRYIDRVKIVYVSSDTEPNLSTAK